MVIDKTINLEKAILRAEALCARQERCSHDIRMKLKQWNVTPKDIEEIIKQLKNNGFINDERYARMFVRDKIKFNKWGPLKITYALRSKQIPEDLVKEIMNETEQLDDNTTLHDLLLKKMKGIKAKSPYDLKTKLIRFGLSRGYNYELVNKTASIIIIENKE